MAEPEHLVVDRSDLGDVEARMARLAEAGRGWINLQADVDPEEVPDRPSGLLAVFGARGPLVPFCTWVAGERRKGRQGDPSIGIQHASGTKAADRLSEGGLDVPAGWRVVQDHPKRGLAVQVPASAPHGDVLRWLVRAGEVLAGFPLPDRYLVVVHQP